MTYEELKTTPDAEYSMYCTGDVCTGDTIRFVEAVFSGSHRKPKFAGSRTITAIVVNDSYGADKQQHTFSLDIISSEGYDALKPGTKTTRKGRNVYRNDSFRKPWVDESARRFALSEKHTRGDKARAQRDARKMEAWA